MKKKKAAAAGLTFVLLASVLTGCSDDREDMLEDKVEKLEQQVTDLEKKNAGNDSGGGTSDKSTEGQDASGQSAGKSSDYETLKAAVDAAAEKAGSVTPAGSAAEQREQYYELKNELDDIDHQLDLYDDMLEDQYRGGTLDAAAYRQQEKDIDALEDILDTTEDRLEILFGIDD